MSLFLTSIQMGYDFFFLISLIKALERIREITEHEEFYAAVTDYIKEIVAAYKEMQKVGKLLPDIGVKGHGSAGPLFLRRRWNNCWKVPRVFNDVPRSSVGVLQFPLGQLKS